MDSRFVRVWREARDRRTSEPFDRTLARMDAQDLVRALAGAGQEDPVAANAIATELLNRLARARAFGAFVVVGILAVALLVFDLVLTGTLGIFEEGPVTIDLSVVAFVLAIVALLALVNARLAWRRLRVDREKL